MEGDGANSWREFLDSKINGSEPILNLIREIRVSNFDSGGKKAILRTILEEGLSKVSNEEWMLEAFELLQEVHRSEGSLITPSMTTASSSVAAIVNARRHAINDVKVYLNETRVNNPPSSPPEKASPLEIPKDTQLHNDNPNAINFEEMVPSNNKIDDHVEMDSSTSKVDPEEEMDSSTNKIDSLPSHEVPNEPTSNPTEVPNEPTSAPTNVNRPSLMESTSSPSSHKLNDSIELLGGKSNSARRFHLPSPKRKRFSPLKSYEMSKIAQRRKVKRWSRLEEQTLKTAVRKFGEGKWKLILDSYQVDFDERTTVDLKDKWRNMKQSKGK